MTNSGNQEVAAGGDRQAFEQVRKCVLLFGAVSAIVLATVAAVALTGGSTNTFMWVRAVILLIAAPVLHRLVVRAAREERKSLERLRAVTAVLPIAIVGVDLIPGVCPPWYAVMQAVSAVPLVAAAVITRRRGVRAAQ